jgi:hypothetical protein
MSRRISKEAAGLQAAGLADMQIEETEQLQAVIGTGENISYVRL